MKIQRIAAIALTALVAGEAAAEIVLYSRDNFDGRSFTATRRQGNLEREGFNDRASSAVVFGQRWEVCSAARFEGRCVVLRPGRYPSLESMGIGNSISSVRPVTRETRVDEGRFAPPPMPVYDSRRRKDERLFEAEVVAVRAVYGRPEQRCWVEREQVADRSNEIGGAVLGGLIGGVLGHQIGSGRGNDLATGIGAVAGAAIGSNVARDSGGNPVYTQDVRRCERVPAGGRPEYWDVVYRFRGEEHRMQTSAPPGRTITVNRRGEPRTPQ